jgi:hypothetical protein
MHCGPRFDSASNRNKYQESSWGLRGAGRYVRLTTSPSYVSWLPGKCDSLDVSQAYGPLQACYRDLRGNTLPHQQEFIISVGFGVLQRTCNKRTVFNCVDYLFIDLKVNIIHWTQVLVRKMFRLLHGHPQVVLVWWIFYYVRWYTVIYSA